MDKFTDKKQRNQVFQKFIKRHVKEGQMDLIKGCNTFLSFVADRTLEKNCINLICVKIDFVLYVHGEKREKMH